MMKNSSKVSQLIKDDIQSKIIQIYKSVDSEINTFYYTRKINELIKNFNQNARLGKKEDICSEKTILLISYADNLKIKGEKNTLNIFNTFFKKRLKQNFNCIHFLPFFPSSSDSGFAVKDHNVIDKRFGNWDHIKRLSKYANIMADIVINHASSKGVWFKNFLKNKDPGKDYFFSVDRKFNTKKVIRPREHPLLQKFKMYDNQKKLWCTFSPDQVDLNFKNPDVLIDFVKIMMTFISKGISIFRLDAVGYLWKETNTECVNLPQTHQIIKLFRLILERLNTRSWIVTETNLPGKQNLSYFGNNDEAHWIYNFSLPPLVAYTLLFEDSTQISNWSKSMPPARNGNTYLNFLASHDGIGMRPIEGILNELQSNKMFLRIKKNNGKFSYRKIHGKGKKIYEANITLFDLLSRTDYDKKGNYKIKRFLAAHAIMFSLDGIPGIYFNSLFGTSNDISKFKISKKNRDLNRHKWDLFNLQKKLGKKNSKESIVFSEIMRLLKIRKSQEAFHPNATQYTLDLGKKIYGLWRQSKDKRQSIFSVTNITSESVEFNLNRLNLIKNETWRDLINPKTKINGKNSIKLKPFETLWISNY
ncbi:MAG: alpha-amylase [Candidatus Pelagibacter sp.]|nr:alpha-amylase [Candidatus Pelagibacter sp.]